MLWAIIGFAIALAGSSPARASERIGPSERLVTSDHPNLEDDERIVDGISLTPVRMEASLAGFRLEMDTAIVREIRTPSVTAPSTAALPATSLSEGPSGPRAARVTDVRLTARRTFSISPKFFLDTLVRAEMPTGNVQAGLGRGRAEFMADLGVRSEIGTFSLWMGGARKINRKTTWSPGKDVNEVYAGASVRVNRSSDFRIDFVSTQKRASYLNREQSISAEYSKAVGKGKRVAVYAGRYRGTWGNDLSAGATLRLSI